MELESIIIYSTTKKLIYKIYKKTWDQWTKEIKEKDGLTAKKPKNISEYKPYAPTKIKPSEPIEHDGFITKEIAQNDILKYNFNSIDRYIKKSCLTNDIYTFLQDLISFLENQIRENLKHGYVVQLYRNRIRVIREYIEDKSLDPDAEERIYWKPDNSNLNKYIDGDKIEQFVQIEQELIQRQFLTKYGIWDKPKNELIALIHILKQKNYFLRRINNKSTEHTIIELTKYLGPRYSTEVTQQGQATRFNPQEDLKSYKFMFQFIR